MVKKKWNIKWDHTQTSISDAMGVDEEKVLKVLRQFAIDALADADESIKSKHGPVSIMMEMLLKSDELTDEEKIFGAFMQGRACEGVKIKSEREGISFTDNGKTEDEDDEWFK